MTSDTPAGRRFRVFNRRRSAPSRARRRLGAAVRMLAALALAGGVYTAFAPGAFAVLLGRTFLARTFTHEQAVASVVVSYYWHFVDVVWIALFGVIYILR